MARRLTHRVLQVDKHGTPIDYTNAKLLEKFPSQFFQAIVGGGVFKESYRIFKVVFSDSVISARDIHDSPALFGMHHRPSTIQGDQSTLSFT